MKNNIKIITVNLDKLCYNGYKLLNINNMKTINEIYDELICKDITTDLLKKTEYTYFIVYNGKIIDNKSDINLYKNTTVLLFLSKLVKNKKKIEKKINFNFENIDFNLNSSYSS